MIGRGTIINVLAIIVGASGGLLLKNGIPERMKHTIMQGIGLAVVMLGLSGALQELSPRGGRPFGAALYHADDPMLGWGWADRCRFAD